MAVNEQLPVRRVRVRIPLELDQAIVAIRAGEGKTLTMRACV